MITEKKLVLTSNTPHVLENLAKFEGLAQAFTCDGIAKIWNYNKTPFVNASTSNFFSDSDVLEVPDFGSQDFTALFTNWAHNNYFEPGEPTKSSVRYDSSKEPCIFCSIAKHKGMHADTDVYNASCSLVDMILYESENFFVTVELGSLKNGFLMIMPKPHILSVAQMPTKFAREYLEVCRDVEFILKETFGSHEPVIFFEHGCGPSGRTAHKKSIVHAHTHVVHGVTIDDKYLRMISANPVKHISIANNVHYFAYKEGAEGQVYCCYDSNVFVPRQFGRQVIAKKLGFPPHQFNWRSFTFAENTHSTVYFLYKFLTSGKIGNLRILQRTEAFVTGYAHREDFVG